MTEKWLRLLFFFARSEIEELLRQGNATAIRPGDEWRYVKANLPTWRPRIWRRIYERD